MKRVVFLVAWLLASTNIPAQAKTISNEAVLDSLFLEALDSLAVSRHFDSSGVQIIVSALSPEKQAFCRDLLIRYFNRKKIPVFQTGKKAKLALDVFEPKIEYWEPTSEILGFGGRVKRKVKLILRGWMTSGDGQKGNIALTIQLERSDSVKRNRVSSLEESPFLFTRGVWVNYSRWTRYLQPAVVFGSVSLLIYLFFSLRS